MAFLAAFALCAVLFAGAGKAQVHFSYEGYDGPDRWAELFPKCGGQRQSPVDIQLNRTKKATSAPIWLNYAGSIPWEATLTNDGHTAMVRLDAAVNITLQGGPLAEPHIFQQMHFHWGKKDSVGTEHAVNSRFGALEMHMVFYKQQYGSPGSAANHSDGFAVLSVLHDVHVFGSPVLEPILWAVQRVPNAGDETSLDTRLALEWLLQTNRHSYYTYQGSLTTPPCDEAVKWIVFSEPASVSSEQVAVFRTMRTEDGSQLTSNRRPLQPLGDRTVSRVRYAMGRHRGSGSARARHARRQH